MSPEIFIVADRSGEQWTDPDLPGDITNAPDFSFDYRAYAQGQRLETPAFRFEVWNEELDGLDWLRLAQPVGVLVVSDRFAGLVQELSPQPLNTYPVVFEKEGRPFSSRQAYVVLQLGAPRDFFDREHSDYSTRKDFDGNEEIRLVKQYRFRLPQQVPPLFHLDISPYAPTFATAAFLDRARQQGLTNVAYMDAAAFSSTNQLRPL